MSNMYLVVKERTLENPVSHISTIVLDGASLDEIIQAEKIEQERIKEKFPMHTHRMSCYVGGEFRKDSPEGIYFSKNNSPLTVQEILAGN